MIVGVGAWLARSTPGWWTDPPGTEAQVEQAAQELRNGVINQVHLARESADDLRPGEPWRSDEWRVALKGDDVNAWLEEELPRWLANQDRAGQWPAEVKDVRVAFEPGLAVIGARVNLEGVSTVVSMGVEPRLSESGELWIKARWVRLGRLPAPVAWVGARLRPWLEQAGAAGSGGQVLDVLEGQAPVLKDAALRLEDGRRVRLMDLEARPGELWVTARTEQQRGT